jgi:cytochrome c-type biogenesis protein CcmH
MEEDYKTLVAELRCLVCQNQNLADSNAELAVDMRTKVYNMLNEGKSKAEIADFMVARYGDFVLYRPPVKSSTFMLWFGPFIFLLVGALIAISYVRRQQKSAQSVVDSQTQKRAHSLLDDD